MKVILFYNGSYPDGMAMSNRIHLYGRCLYAIGSEVEVIIPSKTKDSKRGIHVDVPFSSVKSPLFFRNYLLLKLNAFFAAFIYAYYSFCFSKRADVIFICGFGWFSSMLAGIATHIGGAKIVMEVNENPYAPEGGKLDPVLVRRIRRFSMLHTAFKLMDGFIVISEKLEELVYQHKKKQAFILKIPILVDKPEALNMVPEKPEIPFVLHTGALSETKDGMLAVFEGFARAHLKLNGALKFILTQKKMHPALSRKICDIAKKYELQDSIQFTGHLSKIAVEQLRMRCTLTIINKPSNWQNDYNFPTKLGEYMVSGIPMIVTATGELKKHLNDSVNAFLVPENDPDAIAEKIVFIIKNPIIAKSVGQAGKDYALKNFYYLNYMEDMKRFFTKVGTGQ